MTEQYKDPSLTNRLIEWTCKWGEEPPEEISVEMRRIEEKAKRIISGSDDILTTEEIFYLNNKDCEMF